MEYKNIFKKYLKKMILEGVLKALIIGFIVGVAVSLIFAILAVFTNSFATLSNYGTAVKRVIWIAVLMCFVVGSLSTLVSYFLFFKPKASDIARRVDRLGLEERAVTMIELEKDQSYIAMCQREDALTSLKKTGTKQLKITIFMIPLIALAVAAMLTSGTIVITAETFNPPLEWNDFRTRGSGVYKPGEEVSVIYEISDGGIVYGETNQLVPYGGDSTEVTAVAEYGYVFIGWYNMFSRRLEGEDPTRIDKNVHTAIYLIASFEKIEKLEPDEDGDEEGEKKPGEPGDTPTDETDPGDNPKVEPNDGSGGAYKLINTIIDGLQDYQDNFEEYKKAVLDHLAESNYPDHIIKLIDLYLRQLEPAQKTESSEA